MKKFTAFSFSILMIILSVSVAVNSMANETVISALNDPDSPQNVISPLSQLNQPGHQEGSIFTDTTLSSGSAHTCAILDDGSVSCWGFNGYGGLGDGTDINRNTPTQTSTLGTGRTAVAVSSGFWHTCAILDDGTVSCWGRNLYGGLGDGTTTVGISNHDRTTPTQTLSLGTGRTAVAISTGGYHTCAILDDGSVSCWGWNNNGELGDGTYTDRNTPTQTSSLGTGRTAVAISSGALHTCVILDDASVSCWGSNSDGELGDGTNIDRSTPTQTSSLGTGRTAVAISSGDRHTCAILDDGSVSCWGYNYFGQLGDGTTTNQNTPTQTFSLGTGRTAVAISSGEDHTCAILDDGSVSCWGWNGYGQLGDGTNTDRNTPTQTSSLGTGRTAVAISSGRTHTCAILDDATVSCWGWNDKGQLGDGTTADRNTPTQTSSLGTNTNPRTAVLSERDFDADGILNIFDIHPYTNRPGFQEGSVYTSTTLSSGGSHTCAVLDNGAVSCWGDATYGQLGYGGTGDKATPRLTSSLGTGRTAVEIGSGGVHTCAILDNGAVSCWGMGTYGQLGNGGTNDKSNPTMTSSLGAGKTAISISSGVFRTCVILDSGDVSCWGLGNRGALGNGGTADKTTPTLTSSLGTGRIAIAISTGGVHTCALLDNGSVSCWGRGAFGSLGNGDIGDRYTPTLTNGFGTDRTAVAISSARAHTCAILDIGSVSCWGEGSMGQIGNGAAFDVNTPTLTSSLGVGRTAIAISSGSDHTCAILDNGEVSCWGNNDFGQLGNGGTSESNPTPTLTSSFGAGRTAVAIASGGYHTCVVLDNNAVSCWGWGTDGRLGNGATITRTTPTLISSLGNERTVPLSERDLDWDSILNIFEDIICSPGYYQPNSTCVPADAGYFVASFGQVSQTPCSAGRYQDLTGQEFCKDASAGHYVDDLLGEGQTNQTPCQSGTYNPINGSTSMLDCLLTDAGHYTNSSSGIGQSTQTPCPLGTYQAQTGMSECDGADAGHFVDESFGTGQSSQTPCPAGTYQALTGQTSCDGADAGFYIDQSLGTGQADQLPCPAGTYQQLSGQTSCDGADAGYYVDESLGTGQTSQTPCQSGTYQTLTGQTSCDGADAGHYIDESLGTGQSSQSPCPRGTYNPNNDSTNISDCIEAEAGHFVDFEQGTGQASQTPCPIGTYNPDNGSLYPEYCIYAIEGFYVNSSMGTGQISQTPCPSGTYNPTESATSLLDCIQTDTGYYTNPPNGMGSYQQTPCLPGTFQSSVGQNYCDPADAGFFVNDYGSSAQKACEKGEYQPLTGLSNCDLADPGYHVDAKGQANQTLCPPGTYSNISGAANCLDAGHGFYVLDSDKTTRVQCPAFTYTYVDANATGNNSDELSDCWLDTDGDMLVDNDFALNFDDDDDNDGFKDSIDIFPLDPNEWEDINGDGIGDNQKPLTFFESISYGTAGTGTFAAIILLPFGILVGVIMVIRSRKKTKASNSESTIVPNQQPNNAEPMSSLPLPASGLPAGWTIEQWQHYGEEWMSSQTTEESLEVVDEIPTMETIGNPDGNGYEWFRSNDGANWYRTQGSSDEWTKFES